MDTSCSLSDPCSKLFFWKDSITCVWFTLSIPVCSRHFGCSVFVKQLQAELILILMWFSLLLHYVVVPYLFQASDGYFTLWLPMFTFIFLLAVLRNTLISGFFTAVSITSYLFAWPLRFHAFLQFTSIGYLVCSLGTLYYSCTGLFPINLEQYLLWVI